MQVQLPVLLSYVPVQPPHYPARVSEEAHGAAAMFQQQR